MQSLSEGRKDKFDLSMPVQFLKGVGPVKAKTFAQLGVETVGDLLEYFPRDWAFTPDTIKINQMQPGQSAAIIGQVESVDYQAFRRSQVFEAVLADETGVCRIVWFHGGYLRNQLQPGMMIMASGKVSLYKHQLQMTNPKFVVIDEEHTKSAESFSGGVYPASAGLSSRQIKRIIAPLLDSTDELAPEFY
ncbi:MAG: OB-fold nucleic acid binding domain-containing protein, partial [Phycisphaerae bacterium]